MRCEAYEALRLTLFQQLAGVCRLVCEGQMLQWLQRVQGGERVHDAPAPPGMHLVYEDADLACVVKPQGMPVAVRVSACIQGSMLMIMRAGPADRSVTHCKF